MAKTGTVTFAAGETSKTVTVAVNGDTAVEPDEQFFVDLSGPQNATLATKQRGIGTILNNDTAGPGPQVSVGDASVLEGNSGPVQASFALTRSGDTAGSVDVDFATADDSAIAPSDYASTLERVTIPSGQSSVVVTVAVNGDTLDEADEQFRVNLSNPSAGATVGDGQGIGTIRDDDDAPSVSVSDTSVTEGDAGDVVASFDVSLSAPSGRAVTVPYATANGSATEPADYTQKAGSVTFAAGETSKTVTAQVKGDLLDEANEQFFADLSTSPNVTLAKGRGVGTIEDNDLEPTLSIDDRTVTEGNSGQVDASFTVSLSAASGREVSVDLATADQTARAPEDYDSKSATVVFAAGESTKTVAVKVNGDTQDEPDERFLANLAGAQNAAVADNQGIGTITDDDQPRGTPRPDPEPPADSPVKGAGCVNFRSGMGPRRVGPAQLGLNRKRHRAIFKGARLSSRSGIDRACIAGGGSLRIGYPTKRLLRGLSRSERRRIKGRAVLVLTSSPRYSIRGIKPGGKVRALRRKLRGERAYRVGGVTWYLAPARGGRLAFRTRAGRVVEIGIADKRLTSTARSARRLLGAWRL